MSRAYYCTVEELNERGRENIPGQFKSILFTVLRRPLPLTLREQKGSESREQGWQFRVRSC